MQELLQGSQDDLLSFLRLGDPLLLLDQHFISVSFGLGLGLALDFFLISLYSLLQVSFEDILEVVCEPPDNRSEFEQTSDCEHFYIKDKVIS